MNSWAYTCFAKFCFGTAENELTSNLVFFCNLDEFHRNWKKNNLTNEQYHDRLAYITSKEPTIELMLNQAAMLSRSERALLNLARAFIYNPEVPQR